MTPYNGYLQWPKFGFDAALPEEFKERLGTSKLTELGVDATSTILSRTSTREGREAWKELGVASTLTLQLDPPSKAALKLLDIASNRPSKLVR